jgi:hypothetical protein
MVMLLNQNLVTLVCSTRELQSIFLKVQAQLIELVGPQVSNDQDRHRRILLRLLVRVLGASPKFGSARTTFGGHRPTNAYPKFGTYTFFAPCRDFTRG